MINDKKLINKIRMVLLNDWDPIGISSIEEAKDEYDLYIYDILNAMLENQTKEEIASFLGQIEKNHMGLTPNLEHNFFVSEKLLECIK